MSKNSSRLALVKLYINHLLMIKKVVNYFLVVSGMFLIILGFITFLILLGFFLYELLTPGSLFRYYLCRIGSSSGPQLSCMYNTSEEVRQRN